MRLLLSATRRRFNGLPANPSSTGEIARSTMLIRHASSASDINGICKDNYNLFSKTDDHDALRSMLRSFVRREVRESK
jgi:hypothetical protein